MNIAVILAAGIGKRMNGRDKVLFRIKGRPLFFYTAKIFQDHPKIDKIIFVARKTYFKNIFSAARDYKLSKIAGVVEGGKERQDSAFLGLAAAGKIGAKKGDLILFHNAANPMALPEEISEVLAAARKYKAALLAMPAKDTIKEVDKNGFLVRTLDRKKIFLAQVPQVIEYSLAQKAAAAAKKDKFYGTDDVSLVERLGKKVKIVPCSCKNIKITARDDLKMIASFIR
ncbi:MAG: 2-C-methyl-D-erythritol 4-phosphate cytidylyltransferase [Patescibacteria group bacterium]